ncbi:hypothetical protein AB0E08_08015 [Streptomyces sp. NPDC048281]|uniref:hypothetical protein n=1 Tax=Streptomyces sp. NPDC048281 TaxID=3154715 RepID=UPI0034134F74
MLDLSAPAYGKAAVSPSPVFPGAHPQMIRPAVAPETRVAMAATDLLDAPTDWSWEQLRDYVMRSVLERHGPQPRHEQAKINSIFKSFAARWGTKAGPIARFAFEQQDGYWRDAPVDARRFTKGNDGYFAGPIAERLADA